jgi:hypothetical protein
MPELTTDVVTETVEAVVTETVEATAVAVQSGLRLTSVLLRVLLGLLMVALGAILWLITTVLLDRYYGPRSHSRRRAHA